MRQYGFLNLYNFYVTLVTHISIWGGCCVEPIALCRFKKAICFVGNRFSCYRSLRFDCVGCFAICLFCYLGFCPRFQ